MQRLKPYGQVVLLSGDVHYSASTVMSYFTKGEADPARIVQFTSSGFKNVMPSYITVIDRSLALAHLIVRQPLGAERMGWFKKPSDPIVLGEGKSGGGYSARVSLEAQGRADAACRRSAGRTTRRSIPRSDRTGPGVWSRSSICVLTRSGRADPAVQDPDARGVQVALTEAGGPNSMKGFHAVAGRQQHSLETLKNSRQILFRSNFGLVRFERREGVLHAIHEMYTAARSPEETGT